MHKFVAVTLLALLSVVLCKPLDVDVNEDMTTDLQHHSIQKRFVNPMFALGGAADAGVSKMRTKRQAEECEKLALCKLHARSQRNFFAAYELYFVNKENARLWDHHARSITDCEERYGDCYDE